MFTLCQAGDQGYMGSRTQPLTLQNSQAIGKERLRKQLHPEKYGKCYDGDGHGTVGTQSEHEGGG